MAEEFERCTPPYGYLVLRVLAVLSPPEVAGARRVAGLRREEVVLLAGVSIPYYTRLERNVA